MYIFRNKWIFFVNKNIYKNINNALVEWNFYVFCVHAQTIIYFVNKKWNRKHVDTIAAAHWLKDCRSTELTKLSIKVFIVHINQVLHDFLFGTESVDFFFVSQILLSFSTLNFSFIKKNVYPAFPCWYLTFDDDISR
jgi:hypothetical protein